jgi:hypothetical protein
LQEARPVETHTYMHACRWTTAGEVEAKSDLPVLNNVACSSSKVS